MTIILCIPATFVNSPWCNMIQGAEMQRTEHGSSCHSYSCGGRRLSSSGTGCLRMGLGSMIDRQRGREMGREIGRWLAFRWTELRQCNSDPVRLAICSSMYSLYLYYTYLCSSPPELLGLPMSFSLLVSMKNQNAILIARFSLRFCAQPHFLHRPWWLLSSVLVPTATSAARATAPPLPQQWSEEKE